MKINNYKYIISTALALLSSCGDDIDPVYTVGEADNAIVLSAGVVDGGATVKTRATWDDSDDVRHGKHLALASGINMQLQVSGIWKGHKKANNELDENIVYSPTATVKAVSGEEMHNAIEFSPAIYWDDYGTADPNNKKPNNQTGGGREIGLTIYAAAFNKPNTAVPEIGGTSSNTWESLSYSVAADQSSDWSAYDLIISNNIQAKESDKDYTGTLKFDDWKDNTNNLSNLLEFKHVMSKVTINLKANDGFPSTGENLVGYTDNKFESNPTVDLLTRNDEKAEIAYAITNGSVNVTDGSYTKGTETAIIHTKLDNIHAAWGATSEEFKYTVQMTALVSPGTPLGASEEDVAKAQTIAKIIADGNVYYVNALEIFKAIKAKNYSQTTEPGKNYILNITLNKTSVHVEATVANWIDVVAEEAKPKIDVTTSYGTPVSDNSFGQSFSIYKNERKDYTAASPELATPEYFYGETANSNGNYAENRWYNVSATGEGGKVWLNNATSPLYWPNHSTKYYLRGVFPRTKTDGTTTSPAVTKFTDTANKEHQGIAVSNSKYESDLNNGGKFPSDLMIGIPYVKSPETTGPQTEPDDGISATEGTITLNFTYRMAQVEVRLLSSGRDEPDNIDFGSNDGAEIAEVTITNGMINGYVLLADGSIAYASGSAIGNYIMSPLSNDLASVTIPTKADYESISSNETFWTNHSTLVRHDAIIPQSLGTGDSALNFVIKTGSSSMSYDTYSIPIKDIKLTYINGVACTEDNNKITEWEAGKHYIYTLKITKTKIKIEASIQNWIPVVAGGDFWL